MPYILGEGEGRPLERDAEGGSAGWDGDVDFADLLALWYSSEWTQQHVKGALKGTHSRCRGKDRVYVLVIKGVMSPNEMKEIRSW